MQRPRILSRPWAFLARQHPSALLLAAQLLSLLIYPSIDDTSSGRLLFGAVALVVVPLAVLVVGRTPAESYVAWVLAIPAMVLTAAGVLLDEPGLLPWSAALEALLYFYAAGSLIYYMMNDHDVSADELFAAGATFTLLAWGFAYAYFVCQAIYPDSFMSVEDPGRPRRWLELLSLSFSNLSATGLSDILPMGSPARVLVMLEQFAGIGYIATVVSRLIGLTIVRHRK